jgi:cytochrome c oxidase subunit 2
MGRHERGNGLIGSANLSAWFPEWASTFAPDVDVPFFDLYVIGTVVLVLVVGLTVVFMRSFKRKDGDPEARPAGNLNRMLVGVWVLAALGLAGFAFWAGLRGVIDQSVPPYGAYRVTVTAREGRWDFTYPGGHMSDTLRVAVDQPVLLTMISEDISHTLSIPAMRVQQAILAGRTSEAWFEAINAGTYPIHSSAFSELTQDNLATAVVSLPRTDFEAWLAAVGDIFVGRTLPEVGELLYNRQGCKACHSLDGSKLVGPSLKNVYGYEFKTVGGNTIVADDAYIKESILDPNASVIEGYQPVMTAYAGILDDREIEAIVEFLKTISDRGDAGGQEEE